MHSLIKSENWTLRRVLLCKGSRQKRNATTKEEVIFRPEESRPPHRSADDSYYQPRGGKATEHGRYRVKRDDYIRNQSILSRTSRNSHFNSAHHRNNTPSFQYRVVDRSRLSSSSVTPHRQEVLESRGLNPNPTDNALPGPTGGETIPIRSIKERLGPSPAQGGTHSGSKERRPALERLSEPAATVEQIARKAPGFESGRLQLGNTGGEENEIRNAPSPKDRVPASLRLGESNTDTLGGASIRGTIPIAA